ncbi:MAG TPA: sigma-70 family RNA polymerase sigma factor [Gemmatimonadaceae bacterium]|nr:sigma-70 family RNA polymerase sigma factor [Gemmatimonadaceae bacterium]
MMQLSTEDTISSGAVQPRDAFAACYQKLYPRFKRYAWAELGDAATAEEATISTLVALWERQVITANKFVELESLAYRMLKLRISNIERARSKDTGKPTMLSSLAARARSWIDGETGDPDLEQVVNTALAEMRPRCREVFLLRREAGMSCAEIAAMCGTGPRSVTALMHRAQFVLRDHVDRAGFGSAARRSAADTGRWRIAEFNREPEHYESQEAIIEREGNPESALISDYIIGELSTERATEVARRLEEDDAFREIAEPLLMAWSLAPRSQPVTSDELARSWDDVRRRAGVPT